MLTSVELSPEKRDVFWFLLFYCLCFCFVLTISLKYVSTVFFFFNETYLLKKKSKQETLHALPQPLFVALPASTAHLPSDLTLSPSAQAGPFTPQDEYFLSVHS